MITLAKGRNYFMSIDNIYERIKNFVSSREWDQFHSPENLAKSISIESGELLECFQWDNNVNLENIKDELADILIYSILLARKYNLDISTIINEKIDKNEKKYPVRKAKGNSKKYTEFGNDYED